MPADYNETLNLPRTDFPMRAGLTKKEPELLEAWESNEIYKKIMKKNAGKPIYVLHDGPPYANGNIHLGHALNKILKDIVVRYKNMSGFKAPFVPGWDTHGLPTELKARAKVGIKKAKTLTDIELRRLCAEFAMGYVNDQRDQFKRLGVLGDWERAYITLLPEFEKKQIEIFAKMAGKGSIYRGLKPVYWCSSCETALAEAEIEYSNDDCKSIYVKFKIAEDNGNLSKFGIDLNKTYFIIWTTTAWTLPGNVAICVGPKYGYSIVKSGEECYIIANKLVEETMKVAGIEDYQILGEITGENLEYIKAFHPFLQRKSLVILGDHVTLESGTGCVHTAPGHGVEDFEVCQNYKDIPIIVPVDSKGILTDEAGEFKGLNTHSAGEKIIDKLSKEGYLFASKEISHQYPHCWRCKNPILFRATKQWFCSIDKFKTQALSEIEKVNWIPGWGKERISSMVSERKDWCISRQRKWGVPIPIFFCEHCNEPLLDSNAMQKVAELFGKEGSDAWYIKEADEILPESTSCHKCGNKKFFKETDIMDVWFDSGVTHAAVCNEDNGLAWPADLYLEGADQYRGWFQSSLLTGVAAFGKSPYKAVATHGWVVDEEGKKQSKSQGNGVSPDKVVQKYGADILRLWVASADYHSDVKISYDILGQLSEAYRKIRNTARYMISNLYDFTPDKDLIETSEMEEMDKWAILRLNQLIDTVKAAYENLEFHSVYHAIHKFCIVDMSNFYLDVLKDRLYVYKAESKARRSAQTCIYWIVDALARLLSPILPFTTQEIWKYMPHESHVQIDYIILNDMPDKKSISVDDKFEEKWDYILKICGEIRKILENTRRDKVIGSSLEAKVTIFCEKDEYEFIKNISDIIKTAIIVSEIDVLPQKEESAEIIGVKGVAVTVERAGGKKCARCWSYSQTVGLDADNLDLCEKCINVLN